MGIDGIEELLPWERTMQVKGVVHCKKEPYDVYIGRPSKWGNPFSIEEVLGGEGNPRYKVMKEYERYILGNRVLLDQLHELDGKVLGCWCKPLECHGDILAQLVTMVNPVNNRFYFDQSK